MVVVHVCPLCNGDGKVRTALKYYNPCNGCLGTGTILDKSDEMVFVPRYMKYHPQVSDSERNMNVKG